MSSRLQTVTLIGILIPAVVVLKAQAPVDPSGHWQGSVSAPGMEVRFELDLQKNGRGELGGTVDLPNEKITGLPLREVTVEGAGIEFYARADQSFRGEIAADGQSMSGTFSIQGAALPFKVKRTGDAHVRAVPKGSAVTKALEGTWSHVGDASSAMRVLLKISNEPDGSSTAMFVNLDEAGLQIPGAVSQQGSQVTIDLPAVGAAYSATLNVDGGELVGTYTERGRSTPATFRRAEPDRKP